MVNSAVKKGLSGNALKYIALAAMTLDHVALAFFGGVAAAYIPMRIVGKLTMPIMCCMLAEGYRYTKSLPKYYLRLFVFAVISTVPYSLVVHDTLFCYTDFNFLFTLILSLAAINVFDKVKNKLLGLFLALIPVAVSYFCDWGITAPLYAMVFFIAGKDPYKRTAFSMGLSILYIIVAVFTKSFTAVLTSLGLLLAPILLYFYSGERGKKSAVNKWLFYIYYPLHLSVIALITYLT